MMSILIPSRKEPKILDTLLACEQEFPWAQVVIANDRDSRGKGWALRQALSQAQNDIICFIDGDMDIHPRMIKRLLPFLEDYDIVLGKKQVRGPLSRRILTRLTRLYTWLVFGVIYDSQTGVKLFRREALPYWETDSYAFDLEIVAKASKRGAKIIEVPVEVDAHKKMRLYSILKSLLDSFKIRGLLCRTK